MSFRELRGNLFNSQANALVNTVNCEGVMGKGIALEFRRRYPEMFEVYQKDCQIGKLSPGKIYPYPAGEILILNFAVKKYWRYPSKLEWVKSCLVQFVAEYRTLGITSIAFPWIGAQNGGIPLITIKSLMREYLKYLNLIEIEVYDFDLYAIDPLYSMLVEIINSPSAITTLKLSGIKESYCKQIIDSYKAGRAKSLAHLAANKIIGEKGIDKLYLFLRDWSSVHSTQTNLIQDKLF